MSGNQILALDVGSANIKAAVGELKKDGKLALLSLFKMPSRGMRKGMVDDSVEAASAINQTLGEVRKSHGDVHKNIYLNIGSAHAKSQVSRGIVAVSRADYEIYQDDVARVVQAAQAVNLPPNRMIVHAINQEYIVDGVGEIKDPLGMVGNRLEVNSLLVDAFSPAVKNLVKCVETVGGGITELVFGPYASCHGVVSKNQKDLGVAMVDIGFGTTAVGVYEDGRLISLNVFPVGAGHITNDLAIGLKVSIEAAEAVKLSFGAALSKDVPVREIIDLKKIDPRTKNTVSRRFIAEIIEVRLAEIFEFINNELKRIGRSGRLPVGVVLAGGGAKLAGVTDLAKQELKLPAQIGIPDLSGVDLPNGELAIRAEDPEFACAIGLLMYANEKRERAAKGLIFGGKLKRIIDYFMP